VPRTHPHPRPRRRMRLAPLAGADDALDVVRLAASDPPEPETVVLMLDDAHVGHVCFVVNGTRHPDDVLDVAHLVGELADSSTSVQAVVLASLRVEHPADHSADHPDDTDRWLEMLDLFDARGVELLDWFVIAHGKTRSMRDMTGMPSAWRGP
jgi:hypothetical protein